MIAAATAAVEPKLGVEPEAKSDLKSLPMPALEATLGSSPNGLSEAESRKRLATYGPNEIVEKRSWKKRAIRS
jgi:H+-transporting ATPase